MVKKDIYVSAGEYFLVKFSDEEKENYMKLMFPENDTSEFYMEKENRELFWRVTRNLKEIDNYGKGTFYLSRQGKWKMKEVLSLQGILGCLG